MNANNNYPARSHSLPIDALAGVNLDLNDQHAGLEFNTPYRCFSSAVLNGGAVWANQYLNLKVAKDVDVTDETPADSLEHYAHVLGHTGVTVGMMTAASIKSARWVCKACEGVDYAVLLTTGLSNARRVGDRADVNTHSPDHSLSKRAPTPGTINIAVVVNAKLSDAALLEIFMLVTEAKVAAVMECNVLSPISHSLATGTGTDSLAAFSSDRGCAVHYVGKHTLLGESIGRTVVDALKSSIQEYNQDSGDHA
ncbi:MAG: adenosylcobinamide amidohydrolase [Pseudomonadota bacterium]